jgi:BirA family biotin operon repressor/biotin-[acetyl-CoA-carboxylase] ligase
MKSLKGGEVMIGKKILFFKSLESTNDYAKEHLEALDNGTVITSKIQTKGKGRRGNVWVSNDGNLYFSFVLKDAVRLTTFDLIMKTSLAIIHSLDSLGIESYIKYPNDIMVRGRKVAGILIENIIKEQNQYVIGVGINCKEELFFGMEKKATSLFIETNNDIEPLDVLALFIKSYNDLNRLFVREMHKAYLEKSIVIGKTITYDNKEALIDTITKDGYLKLIIEHQVHFVAMNEITLKELYYD